MRSAEVWVAPAAVFVEAARHHSTTGAERELGRHGRSGDRSKQSVVEAVERVSSFGGSIQDGLSMTWGEQCRASHTDGVSVGSTTSMRPRAQCGWGSRAAHGSTRDGSNIVGGELVRTGPALRRETHGHTTRLDQSQRRGIPRRATSNNHEPHHTAAPTGPKTDREHKTVTVGPCRIQYSTGNQPLKDRTRGIH